MTALLEIKGLGIEFPAQGGGARTNLSSVRKGSSSPGRTPPPERALIAVRELFFSIAAGEVLGLVGESGSGKSVTSLALMRLLPPQARVSGEILLHDAGKAPRNLLELPDDDMRRLRGSRLAMIFQEPMTALNPVMRVGDQIAEVVLAHSKVARPEAWQRAVEGMREVAIPEPERRARDYPHQLSGGMRQRIMIAMAIVNRPQLLIADEPTTALDVTIQAQILELLGELRARFHLTMLFISHDLAVVSQVADRVAVMYAGNLVELASKANIFRMPAHPYTRGLLKAVPTLRADRAHPLQTIEGSVPPAQAVPDGCPFEPRCQDRIDACSLALPPLVEVSAGHWARCPVINSFSR